MGNPDTITVKGKRVIEESPAIIGAKRMVDSFPHAKGLRGTGILAQDIFSWIAERSEGQIAVLMSGDVGFYSGAKKLSDLIQQHNHSCGETGLEPMEIELIPGISSLQYFCAKLGHSWEDAKIVSLHGREAKVCGPVQTNQKVFFLTGSDNKAESICRRLADRGLGYVTVHVGEKLSYEEERITTGTAIQLAEQVFDSLAVVLVENREIISGNRVGGGLEDDCFLRGDVPMTKQEVRSVTLSKLELCREDVVYDVGAGTGSVSVEMALLCREGQVYAIETNPEAVALIEENKKAFGLCNLHVISGKAPEALAGLPKPDKVFLGGTKGSMDDILKLVLEKNPQARVVVNAIALESMMEAVTGLTALGCKPVDVVQLSSARSKEVGRYHMMTAQNPIFIISAQRKDTVSEKGGTGGKDED